MNRSRLVLFLAMSVVVVGVEVVRKWGGVMAKGLGLVVGRKVAVRKTVYWDEGTWKDKKPPLWSWSMPAGQEHTVSSTSEYGFHLLPSVPVKGFEVYFISKEQAAELLQIIL